MEHLYRVTFFLEVPRPFPGLIEKLVQILSVEGLVVIIASDDLPQVYYSLGKVEKM